MSDLELHASPILFPRVCIYLLFQIILFCSPGPCDFPSQLYPPFPTFPAAGWVDLCRQRLFALVTCQLSPHLLTCWFIDELASQSPPPSEWSARWLLLQERGRCAKRLCLLVRTSLHAAYLLPPRNLVISSSINQPLSPSALCIQLLSLSLAFERNFWFRHSRKSSFPGSCKAACVINWDRSFPSETLWFIYFFPLSAFLIGKDFWLSLQRNTLLLKMSGCRKRCKREILKFAQYLLRLLTGSLHTGNDFFVVVDYRVWWWSWHE